MNKETTQKTIDYMKTLTKECFHMGKSLQKIDKSEIPYPCNTVCCIAGNVVLANSKFEDLGDDVNQWSIMPAWEILGVEDVVGNSLFYPYNDYAYWAEPNVKSPKYVTLERAIHQLEYFLDTDKINWDPVVVAAHRLQTK